MSETVFQISTIEMEMIMMYLNMLDHYAQFIQPIQAGIQQFIKKGSLIVVRG